MIEHLCLNQLSVSVSAAQLMCIVRCSCDIYIVHLILYRCDRSTSSPASFLKAATRLHCVALTVAEAQEHATHQIVMLFTSTTQIHGCVKQIIRRQSLCCPTQQLVHDSNACSTSSQGSVLMTTHAVNCCKALNYCCYTEIGFMGSRSHDASYIMQTPSGSICCLLTATCKWWQLLH